jgi:hypothetical protein
MFSVRLTDHSLEQYKMEHDQARKTLTLTKDSKSHVFALEEPDRDHLILAGALNGDAIRVQIRKIDSSNFLLVNRGFHWINEIPYNR